MLRGMSPEGRWEEWKQHHSQHCYALHFEEGGCSRVSHEGPCPTACIALDIAIPCSLQAKTCAFLHADIAEPASANDPSWLQEKNGM